MLILLLFLIGNDIWWCLWRCLDNITCKCPVPFTPLHFVVMKHSCWRLGINSINGSCRREIECPMGSMDNWVTFNGWIPLPVLLKCDTTRPAVLSCHISSIPWSLRSHKGRAEFLQKSWCLPTVPMLHGHFIYAWCTDVHNQMTESVTKGWRNDVLWLSPRLMPCIFGLDLVASYSKQAWLHWMLGGPFDWPFHMH